METVKTSTEKYVGGMIDKDIAWQFKTTAAARQEQVKEALEHALLMYINCKEEA